MPIQFQCPGCGKILAVGDENAGKQAKCPQCELVSLVPDQTTVYDAESATGSAGPAPGGPQPFGQQPASQPGGSPFGGAPQPPQQQMPMRPINPHLVDAILVTLCCCLPFGIVGIVFAAQCKSQMEVGNYGMAMEYSKKANMWNMIGLVCGLVGVGLYILMIIISAANAPHGGHPPF
ncbi:MAG: CD225/dispanin family protein [Planctomycetia bacterium]|jgi:phage FluMu protein Com